LLPCLTPGGNIARSLRACMHYLTTLYIYLRFSSNHMIHKTVTIAVIHMRPGLKL
jgi:hypothetical protein